MLKVSAERTFIKDCAGKRLTAACLFINLTREINQQAKKKQFMCLGCFVGSTKLTCLNSLRKFSLSQAQRKGLQQVELMAIACTRKKQRLQQGQSPVVSLTSFTRLTVFKGSHETPNTVTIAISIRLVRRFRSRSISSRREFLAPGTRSQNAFRQIKATCVLTFYSQNATSNNLWEFYQKIYYAQIFVCGEGLVLVQLWRQTQK